MACPTATQCTAGDASGREVTFDPTSTTPNTDAVTVDPGQVVYGVACPSRPSAPRSTTVGREVTFDPTSSTPNSTPEGRSTCGQQLDGVACPSTTQCTAVDDSGGEVTFDPTSRTPNSTRHDSTPARAAGVACPSTTQCTAVDKFSQVRDVRPDHPRADPAPAHVRRQPAAARGGVPVERRSAPPSTARRRGDVRPDVRDPEQHTAPRA